MKQKITGLDVEKKLVFLAQNTRFAESINGNPKTESVLKRLIDISKTFDFNTSAFLCFYDPCPGETVLNICKKRKIYGKTEDQTLSPFVGEIESHLKMKEKSISSKKRKNGPTQLKLF